MKSIQIVWTSIEETLNFILLSEKKDGGLTNCSVWEHRCPYPAASETEGGILSDDTSHSLTPSHKGLECKRWEQRMRNMSATRVTYSPKPVGLRPHTLGLNIIIQSLIFSSSPWTSERFSIPPLSLKKKKYTRAHAHTTHTK